MNSGPFDTSDLLEDQIAALETCTLEWDFATSAQATNNFATTAAAGCSPTNETRTLEAVTLTSVSPLKFTAEIKLVKGGFADTAAVTAYTDKLKAESKIFAGASIHKS